MTSRSCLGWWVLEDEWELFVSHVEEKWGSTDGYLRFELESAMREWLDRDDDLAAAERLLRDQADVSDLSSSSSKAGAGITLKGETKKLGHRVQESLKGDFAADAKRHYDQNIGLVLSRALNAYRGGGRARRVLNLVQQIVTDGIAGDTTAESDERTSSQATLRDTTRRSDESQTGGPPGSDENQRDITAESDEEPLVDAMIVADIAGALEGPIYRDDIHREIAKRAGGDGDTIQLYTEAVTNYENLVEHPRKDDLFISEEAREKITVYEDLGREERVEHLRIMLCAEALKNRDNKHEITYSDVQELFDRQFSGAPSYDYAYTLMELAADQHGFEAVDGPSYPSGLRVTIADVADRYIEDAEPFESVDPDLVASLTDPGTFAREVLDDDLDRPDEELSSYSAEIPDPMAASSQEVSADDD